MTTRFKEFYIGTDSELKEDLELLTILKRQVSLYLKENTRERLHGIFNKLFILRKSIDKERFYDILLNEMQSSETKKLTEFILKEGMSLGTFEEEVPELWKIQMKNVKSILRM